MDFVEQVKSSVDIVQVIGEHVRLKKLGSTGRYVGLCPFHQEKTGSFSVHGGLQFYKCFGCGVAGDVFKFVMERERVTFFEALKILAERQGIPMPKRAEYSDPDSKLRGALFAMHEIAAELYRKNLYSTAGAEARAYLAKRGVSSSQAEEFGLGLSLDSWDQLSRCLHDERFAPELLEQSGLVMKRESGGFYDRFRARLMFPIHSDAGKLIGFGGRAMKPGEDAKYLNSPETPLYRKSFVVYNLHRAKDAVRKLENVVLVEGYMDVIGAHSAGVQHVVAICGTSLTNNQVRALKKHSERITVNFDSDAAGANATEKYIQMLLEEGMRVRVAELDGGLDPDEYVKQNGAAAYLERLNSAAGYFLWLADRARRKFDMKTSEGRIEGLNFLLPTIRRVSDSLERATIAEEVASYLGIERGLVLEEFRRSAADRVPVRSQPPKSTLPAAEKLLLHALLTTPEARAQVLPKLLELPTYSQLQAKSIFTVMAALAAEQPDFSFAELQGRLPEHDQDLLAGVVFADELGEEGNHLHQALECLRALEGQDRERHISMLRERIAAAERKGDFDEALRLAQDLNQYSQSASATQRNRAKLHRSSGVN